MFDAAKIEKSLYLLIDFQSTSILNFCSLLEIATEIQSIIALSSYRTPQAGCLIDFLGGTTECITSKIIHKILSYREDGHYILLESFIRSFISTDLRVQIPVIKAEISHFDVSIQDRHYAIVIENKLKNAPFQRNQLARYVKKLTTDYSYDEQNIYIVLLPQDVNTFIRKSAKRLPSDWRKSNDKRKCAEDNYDCWCDGNEKDLTKEQKEWCSHCDKSIVRRLGNRFISLRDNFAEWLLSEADKLPGHEWPMQTA